MSGVMVAFSSAFLLLAVCLFESFKEALCWDNDELELFDLVEEINENFYTLLGIEEVTARARAVSKIL